MANIPESELAEIERLVNGPPQDTSETVSAEDLGLLGDMTSAMGQAAAQTEAEELVALLTGNPDLSDGTPVFDASRSNTVAVALSETALSNARQHLRTVKGLGRRLQYRTPALGLRLPDTCWLRADPDHRNRPPHCAR